MALPALLTRAFYRRQEMGPRKVMGQVPAQGGLEFFVGAYLVLDVSAGAHGLAVRPSSTLVNSNPNLRPLGILAHDKFREEADTETHALDLRGLPDGEWRDGHLTRGLTYWKNGIWAWRLYDGTAPPKVGEKAYLVDETLVRSEPTTHSLWVGRFHAPLPNGPTANGDWLVDHQDHGIG